MHTNSKFLIGLSFIALTALAACETAPTIIGGSNAAEAPTTRATSAYTLGSGDSLRITVFGQPDLTGEFEVDGSGQISMPLIGQLDANKLTVRELEAAVTQRLSDGYVKDPRVSAEVLNYRPFYIYGEVNQPGEYPYTSGLTVQNAVAAAGGYTYRANKRIIHIKSADGADEATYQLSGQLQVQPGDTIRIGERLF